jgi:acyl-CoA synthetase (AMP-forming)/AMP-acid ligase II
MNVADYLLEGAEEDRIALIDTAAQHSYRDLRRACRQMAAALQEKGVGAGDRVGLLASNSLFWVASYLATLKLGAVCVPLSTFLSPSGLQELVAMAGCRALCLQRRHARRLGPSFSPGPLQILSDEIVGATPGSPGSWPAADEACDDRSLATLMFTSGTTARPRLVMVSHGNIRANTESIIASLELTRDDRIMVVLPFFYCFGTSLLHTHLRAGGSLVLSDSFAYPEATLDLMQSTECTGFAGVPSTYQILLRNSSFRDREFPSLKKVQQAGGRLPEVLIRELAEALPEAAIFIMYGQTEATARLSCLPSQLLKAKLGSIGRGIPGVGLQVIGEDGKQVQPGQVGEIVARGGNITLGYLDEPEASAEKFIEGALHTGDLATVDEDGFAYIVDRKADFIKCYGHRVSSQQVEAGILKLPDVVVAAVVGVPDEEQGEAIVAFVTLRDGSVMSPESILEHCRQHLARHMVPSKAVVLTRMPMNANGKILKPDLRNLAVSRSGAGVAQLSSETKPVR